MRNNLDFRFQIQLISQILNAFNESKYTLGIKQDI